MGEVINLNRERKRRQRADKQKLAAVNKKKHGRKKGERSRDAAEKDRQDTLLDQHALDDSE